MHFCLDTVYTVRGVPAKLIDIAGESYEFEKVVGGEKVILDAVRDADEIVSVKVSGARTDTSAASSTSSPDGVTRELVEDMMEMLLRPPPSVAHGSTNYVPPTEFAQIDAPAFSARITSSLGTRVSDCAQEYMLYQMAMAARAIQVEGKVVGTDACTNM